ncbi:MAG: tRNA (adenosine(37)-N6)-threonylcarbamoyltransferase complex dimerization subunit type 1 TsaB [Ruminococcaceae bacterium]|nr:tRNA (adenosine(37)-N6)-threonylcarbamoyltransferase complex dimerization subunit type 1 TsaB [Oscillospiraceae bacterium]
MLIASLDSTAVTASAAICEINGGKLGTYSVFTVKNKLTHSEILLPLLENALKQYGATIKDVDLFAVSAGPGSFTGVRIGAATVKGLAFAENKPCVGVSPLEAMAKTVGRGYVCPVMDARRDQFYTALFKDGVRITEDSALSVEEIKNQLKDLPEVTICGDGRDKFLSLCAEEGNLFPASDAMTDQNAVSVALCGFELFEKGLAVNPESLQPIYLRMPQAERERLEREKSSDS